MKKSEVENCKCKNCGISLKQTSGHRQKTFCSDKCRMVWWKIHQDQIKPKKQIECTCLTRGKTFFRIQVKKENIVAKKVTFIAFKWKEVQAIERTNLDKYFSSIAMMLLLQNMMEKILINLMKFNLVKLLL